MTRVGRAVEKGETKGFIRIVVDRDSDAILGAAIRGSAATRRSTPPSKRWRRASRPRPTLCVMAIHPAVAVLAGSGHIASPVAVHELRKRNVTFTIELHLIAKMEDHKT